MKTLAAVLLKAGDRLRVEELDVDEPGPGEVGIRMAFAGICRSDLNVMTGHLDAPLPAVLGHEGAGVVEDVGPGVTAVRPGDHVIPLWRLSCGSCNYCWAGTPALCSMGVEIRQTGRLQDGKSRYRQGGREIKHFAGVSSFSQYAVVPEGSIVKIPDDLPLDLASLLGCCVITGVGAVINKARVPLGSDVAVVGVGGVGLNIVQAAAAVGAGRIIAIDVHDMKLEMARRLGATHTVNAGSADVVPRVREITDGNGVDFAFEAIGRPETVRQAFDCLKKGGQAIVIGTAAPDTQVTVPVMALAFEEKTLTGSLYGSGQPKQDIPKLIRLHQQGALELRELVTRKYELANINDAFDALTNGELVRGLVAF